jgi:hypothetical protein
MQAVKADGDSQPSPGSDIPDNEFSAIVSAVLARMTEGCPLIRRIDGCSFGQSDTVICVALLSEDLSLLQFIREDEAVVDDIKLAGIRVADIDAVAPAKEQKHAIGVLLPKSEMIVELVFASAEDYKHWYTGLRFLIAQRQLEAVTDEERDGAPVATSSPVGELVELVNELQTQNSNLQNMLNQYDSIVLGLKSQVEDLQRSKRHTEIENLKLKRLLYVREDTINELSSLVQSLIRKQHCLGLPIGEAPEEFFIGTEAKPAKVTDLLKLADRKSPATTIGDDPPVVLQNLESQLKTLENRKYVLEAMLAGQ